MNPLDFNKFFKESFEKLNLDKSAVAVAFQMSPRIIDAWIDGKTEPPPQLQEKIIKWLERRLKHQETIKENADVISKKGIDKCTSD